MIIVQLICKIVCLEVCMQIYNIIPLEIRQLLVLYLTQKIRWILLGLVWEKHIDQET
ncbi:hypothetical protein HanIR_Chr06g0279891 [Helianthus annuus]|nr:hypothetical protein HanIR_Chr06g0279891 [Helianthus annuus]